MPAKFSLFILFFALFGPLSAQKNITLEDIWVNGTFSTKGVPGFNFQNDGIHFTKLTEGGIWQYDLRTGEKSGVIFESKQLTQTAPGWKGTFDGYTFSADENLLLLTTNTESIYRWSSQSDYFVVAPAQNTIQRLYEGGPQRYATFSPDGKKVAFVADNDLYIKDLNSGNTTRITSDGQKNSIINGASDWVYEEEFELVRAFEWSPDSRFIGFLRFDETAVPEMTLELYNGTEYPQLTTFKYPKVGEKNAMVSAFIFDLTANRVLPVATQHDADDYLPRIIWTPDNRFCITRLNRHQNHLWLLTASPDGEKVSTLMEETNPYYIDLHEPHFLSDGSGFIWQTEKNGFNHLYLYDMKGREKYPLTKGNFDVTSFYGADEKNGMVYYQTAAVNPMQREIVSISLKKPKKSIALSGPLAGYHSAQFSKTFDFWVNNYSTINSAPQYTVCDRKGKVIRELEQNTSVGKRQQEYSTVSVEWLSIPVQHSANTPGGAWNGTLNAYVMRPKTVAPGAKLPLLMFVYGGPGSQQVLDQWRGANYWWFQMLVQQGYAVACVDNRGTGARGQEFKKMTYQRLGELETQDQIAAARFLGSQPYIDAGRIGIFGWSYGGYMSSLCLLKGPEVFKAAIAVAPVTNWKWYDSAYTERYMRTYAENKAGYDNNSPVNFAEQLSGQYLLVHGIADDNVHFQNAAEMANQLILNNKQFETMLYPNRNHGIGDKAARLHLYRMMTIFLDQNLKG
jgi:dipeptidyl-peptidase 4